MPFKEHLLAGTAFFMLCAFPAQAADFDEALKSVYEGNPQLQAEREALQATDEGVNQALSGFRPDVELSYQKGRERIRSNGPWTYGNTRVRQATIEQPIFRGGETVARYKQAKKNVKAGRADLHGVEQDVLLDAVTAYADVAERQDVLELSRSNVGVLGKQLGATQERFKVGELTRTDVAQAESRRSRAQADLRQAEGSLQTARATFERVVGRPPGDLSLPPPPQGLPGSLEEAREMALASHPDAVSARYQAKAAEYEVDARTGRLLPNVSLVGRVQRSESVSPFFSGDVDNDEVLLNVRIPIYQSGAEHSRVREAKNLANQARYTELDASNQVNETVRRAWEDYQTSIAVIQSTADAIRASESALEGVKQEQLYGVRTTLDVLDAEQELFSNRVAYVRAERGQTVNGYRLLSAIGRLTARDLGLHVKAYDPALHYDDVKYQLLGF